MATRNLFQRVRDATRCRDHWRQIRRLGCPQPASRGGVAWPYFCVAASRLVIVAILMVVIIVVIATAMIVVIVVTVTVWGWHVGCGNIRLCTEHGACHATAGQHESALGLAPDAGGTAVTVDQVRRQVRSDILRRGGKGSAQAANRNG
jgi:hypothetical protein